MPPAPILKALIPVAGYGARLFPATRAMKKEFFPVVGPDGVARPAILTLIDEALSAGVKAVVLVVQPGDLDAFRAFFTDPLPTAHYRKLPEPLRREADRLLEVGQRIEFAVQPQQEGFGHAVWCGREAIGAQPFLMLLGDHLYRASSDQTCAAQLASVYQQHGGCVVGLNPTAESYLSSRGVVGGTWRDARRLLDIKQFAEKPAVEYARQHLRIETLPSDQYLVLFGQYILPPETFTYLDALIRENQRDRGEFQFTAALEALRRDRGCLGFVVDGETYDIGQPRLYVEALRAYAATPPDS